MMTRKKVVKVEAEESMEEVVTHKHIIHPDKLVFNYKIVTGAKTALKYGLIFMALSPIAAFVGQLVVYGLTNLIMAVM